jgi:hypothetical protein
MVGALAVFCIFGLPIVAYIVRRVLAHNERMEMIRMGYVYGGYPSAGTEAAAPTATRAQPPGANVVLLPPLRNAAPGATISPVRTVLEANRRES